MNKSKFKMGKLIMFFILLVFLILIYCETSPRGDTHYKSYTFNFLAVVYTIMIIGSVITITYDSLTKKNLTIALLCGIVSIGVTVPVNIMGILSGICAFFTYLASQAFMISSENKMYVIRSRKLEYIFQNMKIVFIVICVFVLMRIVSVTKNENDIVFNILFSEFFNALGAGVSEEIIYRMFLFSIILHIYDGEEPPFIITLLILTIPFTLMHFIDSVVLNGFLSTIPYMISILLYSVLLSSIAIKRDLFSAICVHVLINLTISFIK